MPSSGHARYLAPAALVAAVLAILITWAVSTGGDAPPAPDAGQTATRGEPARERGGGSGGERSGGGGGERPGEQERAEPQDEGEGETYTVQVGDNIGSIAEENETTVEEILEVNPEADPQTLQVGDELQLP